jgi:hypothetical protein
MARRFGRDLMERVADEMNKVMGLGPAIEPQDMTDAELLDRVVYEATGGGDVKSAVRNDDFTTADPEKLLFTDEAHQFFVDAGVWDAKAKTVIMPVHKKPAAKPAAAKSNAKEKAAHDTMGAGEETATAGQTDDAPESTDAEDEQGEQAAPVDQPVAKEEPVKTNAAAKTKGAAKAKTSKSTATQKKAGVAKEKKGPGVIATIIELITTKGPITKAQIVTALAKKFPDRDAESMKKTVNAQIPGRISKEHGLKLVELEDKGWTIKKK